MFKHLCNLSTNARHKDIYLNSKSPNCVGSFSHEPFFEPIEKYVDNNIPNSNLS